MRRSARLAIGSALILAIGACSGFTPPKLTTEQRVELVRDACGVLLKSGEDLPPEVKVACLALVVPITISEGHVSGDSGPVGGIGAK